MPLALVFVVDEGRQRLWAGHGAGPDDLPWLDAFDPLPAGDDDLVVVEDVLKEPHAAVRAFAAGAPGYRFYAGVPLVAPEGGRLGTLCLFDRRPRTMEEGRVADLEDLAALAAAHLPVRRRTSLASWPSVALDGVLLFEPGGGVLDASERFLELTGYAIEELVALPVAALHPPEVETVLRHVFERLRKDGFARYEIDFCGKDGEVFTATVSAERFETADGPVVQAVLHDVTEDRNIRLALQEGIVDLFSLIEVVQDGITLADEEGRFGIFNTKMQEVTGYRPDEANEPGFSARLFLDAEAPREAVQHVRRTQGVHHWHARVRARDGAEKSLLVATSLLRYGNQDMYLSAYHDVTERERADAALRQRDLILEAAGYAAERFLRAPSWEAVIDEVLERLGQATGVSRIYIFRQHEEVAGVPLAYHRFEWVADGVEPQIDNPDLQGVSLIEAGYERWVAAFRRGDPVYGAVASFPESEQAVLQAQDIVSLAVMPVFAGEEWWGFLGFDRCFAEHVWSEPEIEALKVVASTLGAAIQRKRDEQALRESERRYKHIVEGAGDVIYRTDARGRFTYVNPVAERITGYPEAELIGMHYLHLVRPDFRDRAAAFYREQVQERVQDTYLEFPCVVRSGQEVWLGQTVQLLWAGGQVAGVQAVARDVTTRRQAEEALSRSESRYRSVVDHVKEVVFQTDAGGRWIFLNPAWTEITGFTVEESLGRPYIEYVHPDDRALNEERFQPLVDREKEHCRHEIRYLTRSGGYRWIEVFARLTLDEAGAVVGTSGMLHDVTDWHQAEEETRRALVRERELNELKSRFTSMTSHEFRTPLATIQTSAELLSRFRYRWDEAKVEKHLLRILNNTRHMTELLDDVLLMGRTEAGRMPFNPERLDVHELVSELSDEMALGLGVRHRFELEIKPPPFDALADPKLLRLILTNLLSNAIKYSPEGSAVRLEADQQGDELVFVVQDSGIGIPDTDLARLFEPFHRASNVGPRRGTGLGLTIVQRALELHGGRIDVHSRLGEGTTFSVRMPLTSTALPVLQP